MAYLLKLKGTEEYWVKDIHSKSHYFLKKNIAKQEKSEFVKFNSLEDARNVLSNITNQPYFKGNIEIVKENKIKKSELRQIIKEVINEFGRMSWEYYFLKNGRLVDEDGYELNKNFPSFKSPEEAQKYLEKNDIRGDVKGDLKNWRK